jgi:DNA-binding winged helix-turn-helix (wHTH) protein
MKQLITSQFPYERVHLSGSPRIRFYKINDGVDAVIRFRRFRVLPHARQLLVDEHPIDLGGRAFDVLMVLLGAGGTIITKAEIMSRVWPSTIVEKSNLKVQMSALRKVLSADRDVIKTVHGRGYVFTGEVTTAPIVPSPSRVRSRIVLHSLCAKSLPRRGYPASGVDISRG